MSNFNRVNSLFATAVTGLYPTMKQVFGTPDEISKATLTDGQDLFGLYVNYRVIKDIRGSSDRTEGLGFFVGEHDVFSDNSPEQNSIIEASEAKANAIVEALINAEQSSFISVREVRFTPQYKTYADTMSGIWCLLTLEINQSVFC